MKSQTTSTQIESPLSEESLSQIVGGKATVSESSESDLAAKGFFKYKKKKFFHGHHH